MEKIIEYDAVSSRDFHYAEARIKEGIRNGYQPLNHLVVTSISVRSERGEYILVPLYTQTMVKYEKDQSKF